MVRVCTKLRNYCIHMVQQDDRGSVGVIKGEDVDPIEYSIEPMTGSGNQHSSNGYLETSLLDDTTVPLPMEQFSSLLPDLFGNLSTRILFLRACGAPAMI